MRIGTRFLAGAAMLAALGGLAKGQERLADLLARKPGQAGVRVAMPTAAEAAGLKAEPFTYPAKAGEPKVTGVIVRDGSAKVVRQLIVREAGGVREQYFTYFLDGVEAFREIDRKGAGKPEIYRWLGPNGGKQGRDLNADGTIDAWEILSAEEASQELVEALASNNTARFQALLVTEKDLTDLGLPAAEANRIKTRVGAAMNRFAAAAKKHALTPQSKWMQITSSGVPSTTPADAAGGTFDITRLKFASVLAERAPGAAAQDNLQMIPTGEMIQVGRAWKLIDGPGEEAATATADALDPKVQPLIDQLTGIKPPPPGSPAADQLKYHVERYTLLEKIVMSTKGAEQEPWIQQLVDALSAAAELGEADNAHFRRFSQWAEKIVEADPKGSNAGYTQFRLLTAEYAIKLAAIGNAGNGGNVAKVQDWWREQLEGYLKQHGTSADAPDAMIRLAIAYEFARDGEAKEIEWCEKLAAAFPSHPFAAKAKGIVARLKSEGQTFALAGPALGGNQNFDVASLKGKPVMVVYWASWAGRVKEDAKIVTELVKEYGPKGLTVVTVCLDDNAQTATQALADVKYPGVHLHQPGGVDGSPLAVQYGVLGPHVFLVNKDGKVVNKAAQLGSVGDEIEKLVK